jgi:hypothetical protein
MRSATVSTRMCWLTAHASAGECRAPADAARGSASQAHPEGGFLSGSLALAFVIHTCRAHGATFPTTLTTTALDRGSTGWFAAPACSATAEGHQTTRSGSSISLIAPIQRLGLLYPASFNVPVRTSPRKSGRGRLAAPSSAAGRREVLPSGRCPLLSQDPRQPELREAVAAEPGDRGDLPAFQG